MERSRQIACPLPCPLCSFESSVTSLNIVGYREVGDGRDEDVIVDILTYLNGLNEFKITFSKYMAPPKESLKDPINNTLESLLLSSDEIDDDVGVQHWVFIGETESAHEVFTTKGSLTSGRPHFRFGSGINGEGGRNITFSDYGKHWKNTRSAMLNVLASKSVDSLQILLKLEADSGVDLLIKGALLSEEGINPLAYTRLTSLNLILAIVFGIQGCCSVQDPIYKEIIENMTETSRFLNLVNNLGTFFPILSFFDIIFRTERQMREFVEKKSSPLYHQSLNIDEDNINAFSNGLTVGGVDTSSIAMTWSLAVLCNHPEWQKKVTDELDLFVQSIINYLYLMNTKRRRD
ncbi:unnamed protein product [Rhizopus stolonifer]